MTARRYGDEEVREIFSLATTGGMPDRSLPTEPDGLTLEELQRIGEEAGIEPARVALAAQMLDSRGTPAPVRRSFGLPVALSRVVQLPRDPTDREWEQLISHFRTTFGAPGQATTSGGLREWSEGSLHIAVEPTAGGTQLRLSARNEAAVLLNGVALVTGGMSVLMTAVVVAAGKPEKALVPVVMFGGLALTSFVSSLIRSPRWRRERERQLDAIAEHAVKLLSDH